MSYQLGQSAGYEAIQHGQSLAPLLEAAVNSRMTQPGGAMLGGLLDVACSVLDACQSRGVKFELTGKGKQIADALPQARRLIVMSMCQQLDQSAAHVLGDLAGVIHGMRDSISLSAPEQVETPEQPVMRVEIVGMPERTTQQSITRREDGEFIGSTSTESDSNK